MTQPYLLGHEEAKNSASEGGPNYECTPQLFFQSTTRPWFHGMRSLLSILLFVRSLVVAFHAANTARSTQPWYRSSSAGRRRSPFLQPPPPQQQRVVQSHDDDEYCSSSALNAAVTTATAADSSRTVKEFDLATAYLCGGLAFDAYVEPAANSSRWERGSGGLAVAYSSRPFARQLYKGILEVKVQKITGLPDTESGQAERLLSGGDGVDACLLVAVVEGQWKEDVEILEQEQFHEGVLDLTGAAHVSRSTTCWSSVLKTNADASERKNGKPLPYFVPRTFNRSPQAIWPPAAQRSMYLYVQDPASARLVFTVLDDDRIGNGLAVGSTFKRLTDLIPEAAYDPKQLVDNMKDQIVKKLSRSGKVDPDVISRYLEKPDNLAPKWTGELPLTSKPRKRNKNSQIMAAAAAGAYLAGPAGAAVGALVANFYEGQVQGRVYLDIKYVPTALSALPERQVYQVKGGLPGIDWGSLYNLHRAKSGLSMDSAMQDLEHCFFVSHEKTGATCSVYRSIRYKQLIVSFRGTCAPIDLLTDASLVQDAWVDGEDVSDQTIVKVHRGFRTSLNSISRRLKELLLAAPDGGNIAEYDMLVTGHSLGGALATLFTADIAEFGIDAGRALPQLKASDPWWKSVARVIGMATTAVEKEQAPPRPKTLQMYNFGSPRVGNDAFAKLFEGLIQDGKIECAYRIVNGEDIVARLPRTVNGLVLGKINYDHVGKTVLVNAPELDENGNEMPRADVPARIWIEGVSDDTQCPIRDGTSLSSPMAPGMLLQELVEATKHDEGAEPKSWTDRFSAMADKVTERIKTIKASELTNILGIDTSFTDREVRIFQSLLRGKAVSHHLEDQYYGGMGKAGGFLARVGTDIVEDNATLATGTLNLAAAETATAAVESSDAA